MSYKPSKLGQTDLVFGLWYWSEFITGSVRAELQVCTLAVMIFNTQRDTDTQTNSF